MNKGGGVSRFSVEYNLSHSAEKVRRGTFSRFTTFGNRKSFKKMGRYQDFPSKYICLTVPKNFVWELFRVSLISGTEKSWESEGEEVSRFSVESSWSHSAEKKRRRESFSVSFI